MTVFRDITFLAAGPANEGCRYASEALRGEERVGVDIDDLRDRSHSIHANWWQWRATVELIRSLGLFDGQRIDHLSEGFGEFTEAEARELAAALERRVLRPRDRVLLDGAVAQKPDDGIFHPAPQDQHRNYSADYDWLVRFVAFCKESSGLYVC